MKIALVSDTHGSVYYWRKIERVLSDVDMIWHLGDVLYHGPRNPLPEGYDPKTLAEVLKDYSINYVRGNCDADVDIIVLGFPEMSRVVEEYIGEVKVVMVHGDVLSKDDEESFAEYHDAKLLLRGHTHIPRVEKKGNIWVLNPGSLSLPKGGSKNSFMMLEFDGDILLKLLDTDLNVLHEEVLQI